MKNNEAIALWNELGITRANMEFSCGGDSMNDYSFQFFDKDDNEVNGGELESFFDNEVFNRVDFYEASDGHYIGESGNVEITMGDEDFEYYKNAESEWSETFSDTFDFKLTKEEYDFIKEKVSNLNGGDSWGGENNVNYKIDCIVTDEEEALITNLMERITDYCNDFEIEGAQGEYEDNSTTWETEGEIELKEIDGEYYIKIDVSARYYVYTPSED